jgi:hypothetical protein
MTTMPRHGDLPGGRCYVCREIWYIPGGLPTYFNDLNAVRCMRHIKLDDENAQIKQFVLSLPVDPDGSILELEGEAVLCVLPVMAQKPMVDVAKLEAAILSRRDESRRLNEDWEPADREVWDSPARD